MIAPPTETSMPPVMMMIVMPTPISAIGAVATSSGWIEPAVRKAGVASARTDPEHGDDADQDQLLAGHRWTAGRGRVTAARACGCQRAGPGHGRRSR